MPNTWLKTAWRHHRDSRLYTLLNLAGLSTGIAVALLIGLWVRDELVFNTLHPNYDRIARVMDNQPSEGGIATTDRIPVPLAAELRNHFGDDLPRIALYFPNFRHILTVDRTHSIPQTGSWVQPDLPVMLTLPMIEGSRDALKDRSNVLISQSLARALFGNTDPMGRNIRVDNTVEVRVGGVFADLPAGSTFHEVGIFLAWDKAVDEMAGMKDYSNDWSASGFQLYVQLGRHADLARINKNIKDLIATHTKNKGETLFLEPMRNWHLYSEYNNGIATGGRIRIVRLFTAIGIFVLLLACINFMNLATARSERRAKEVGVRKVIGSLRRQLIAQFLGEAAGMTIAASALALGIVGLTLPFFNHLSGKALTIPWTNPGFATSILIFIAITALLSGSYPAFYLSRFRPVKVLKGDLRSGPGSSLARKTLVVLQFTVSISLIIGTTLLSRQIVFAKQRPVGYTRAGLINIGKNTKDLYDARYTSLRSDLLHTGVVTNMAEAAIAVTELEQATGGGVSWEGSDPNAKPAFTDMAITADYGATIGWQIIAGRDFDPAKKTDSAGIIINESAARLIGFRQPIGRQLRIWDNKPRTIIGVVRDLVMASPFQRVQPGYYYLVPDVNTNNIIIRVRPDQPMHTALAAIEKVMHRYNPESPFDYRFVDTDYAEKFAEEERVDSLARTFTILAIFISCLGLFGLAAYSAEQRTKEIGVRKVLGSSAFRIWRLLTTDILRLVALSCSIAIPLSGLFMQRWLQQYEYRASSPWWIYCAACGGALFLALFTVSLHAWKAAHTNPIDSLRRT